LTGLVLSLISHREVYHTRTLGPEVD
jgi:hypothetical protein